MNIDNLTIGDARALAKLFGTESKLESPHPFLGKYVVIRAARSGVHVGVLSSVNDDKVILTDTRHIWSWNGALTVSDIAVSGITGGKLSAVTPTNEISEVIEKIPCSEVAEKCLRGK